MKEVWPRKKKEEILKQRSKKKRSRTKIRRQITRT